jgi:hypothetical protein
LNGSSRQPFLLSNLFRVDFRDLPEETQLQTLLSQTQTPQVSVCNGALGKIGLGRGTYRVPSPGKNFQVAHGTTHGCIRLCFPRKYPPFSKQFALQETWSAILFCNVVCSQHYNDFVKFSYWLTAASGLIRCIENKDSRYGYTHMPCNLLECPKKHMLGLSLTCRQLVRNHVLCLTLISDPEKLMIIVCGNNTKSLQQTYIPYPRRRSLS